MIDRNIRLQEQAGKEDSETPEQQPQLMRKPWRKMRAFLSLNLPYNLPRNQSWRKRREGGCHRLKTRSSLNLGSSLSSKVMLRLIYWVSAFSEQHVATPFIDCQYRHPIHCCSASTVGCNYKCWSVMSKAMRNSDLILHVLS